MKEIKPKPHESKRGFSSKLAASNIAGITRGIIELRGICKAFGEQKVLCGINAVLPEKGIVALRGKSGSGKTTLLRIIAGLDSADSGEILGLEGRRISYIFQEDRLLPNVSALENAAIAGDKERARHWLKLFGLDESAHSKKTAALSGGMRRRVSAARAFVFLAEHENKGSVLLLDEPFTGLDAVNAEILKKETARFAKNGLAVLVHHGAEVLACDSELLLESG